tara:strand:- start:1079 stop:1969 length:891 start_codon:yes stop_codon:yes gene_type:complete
MAIKMNKILLLIIISGFCGGSVFPLIKIAEAHDIPKFAYIFWETLFVTIFLTLIALSRKEFSLLKKAEWKYYSFCALTNIFIPQSLFFIIAANMPATTISLLTSLTPLFVYLCLLVFFGETVVKNKMLGLLLGFAGILFLFVPSLITENYSFSWGWLLFSMLLPAVYTLNRIFVTKLQPQDASPYRLAIGLFSIVCIISCTAMVATNSVYIPFTAINAGELALLSHAILMTAFYICFFIISKEGAVQNSLTFYLAPLVGSGWGILLFNETIDSPFIISALLIFYALHLVNKKVLKP